MNSFDLEYNHQSTPAINNNNNTSSINNNNNQQFHSTKNGTNSPKLVSREDLQPLIASIHRNGKSVGNKSVIAANLPLIHAKIPEKCTQIGGSELNEDLIAALSSQDLIDHSVLTEATVATNLQTIKQSQTNLIQANKTIVALSILIQHLTTNVSFNVCFLQQNEFLILSSHIFDECVM